MLSVADLAGYIDTWVLRVPGERANGTGGEDDEGVSSGSSSDSSDDDEESEHVAGERWVRNPKAALLPKLSAAPVVLSFSKAQRDDGDYDLLVITTLKQLLIFNPLRGSLSEWSRRNTYPKLPEQFRDTRDQVKGVLWQGPRAWIYGVSSLFMFDLSQDFGPEKDAPNGQKQQQGMKRKREAHESGAGGKMDKHSLAPQRVRTAAGPDGAKWEDVEMADAEDQKSVGASSGMEDDDEDIMDGGELQRLREDEGANNALDADKEGAGARWWHTYQFRPILGIVPVEGTGEEGEGLPPLEVALVERPLSGDDLPERYFAEGELER
jgi:U3 small nucleolar RNA-associated protein 4